ncbi:RNA-guided pseudouridylation complex pseudouridine synthase subunit Cbf5 [archaeon]|jgi:tRNA U55 pseudouridine synthase TruB|nr:RNA-guided pseudouridylation complex pseudouridine synthase subunit Cbf5 [archaeon]MBT4373293.1 RNA-guided pseudouridylation complex pseudouridine synthase subunit Cbf5 [archaeon]MBT4531638.1 RNA-guided pseudouridylation complex pseudouridine synthase subunit Cbf5 [archaeon]MBT7001184.1 RNA-guided pseudouridylation complex pseudouridine synthase subunit Cbf5 [archaeon]MBT7282330.1 RNA-guided pseudouridylation complex pseudouridine synthase subunit Cbf5 [archaeon]
MKQKSLKELLEFGILNIDKPSGPTSFAIVDFIHKNLNLKKASHFGTLDPKVTGVLPIALSRACKLTGFFLSHDKEYVGIMRMHEKVELKKVESMIKKKFLGRIKQIPPVKSRVARKEREREIYKFELLETDGKDILFKVKCEGGTYIRKLIDDLGKELGIGAHMLELRRVNAGIFSEKDKEFMNLYELEKAIAHRHRDIGRGISSLPPTDAREAIAHRHRELQMEEKKIKEEDLVKYIIPAEEAIKKIMKEVQIEEDAVQKLYHGKVFLKKYVVKMIRLKKDEIVSVFCGEKFVGIYKFLGDEEIFAKPEFVMQPIKG